jgi:23S rRNA A2030 N6-methylase RlmJ
VANPHFANLGDVWKHLWLTGALGQVRPVQYVETHAGSALYRLVDDAERAIGVQTFLAACQTCEPLRRSAYRRQLAELAGRDEQSYPGSSLLAMLMLGRTCRYVFCDTDRASVDDLLKARERLGLQDQVRVVHGDGLAETLALVETGQIGQGSLVHVDPFDFHVQDRGVSALDLVKRLVAAAVPVIAWYHLATPAASLELCHDVMTAVPEAFAWCAELQVLGPRANLAGVGSGCGILLAGAALAPPPALTGAADAYVIAFNDLSASADLGVSVASRFATSAR